MNTYYLNHRDEKLEYQRQYNKTNEDKIKKRNKEYYLKNKDKFKQYCLENKDAKHEYDIIYRIKTEDKRLEYQRQYVKHNKDKITAYKRNRKKNDINFRLSCYLRTRLYIALKNKQKTGSAIKDLGCSITELKQHLENKFIDDMNWENYGKWHIDHIKPLSLFNLENRDEFLKACHYTNLQPMWAKENISKGNRINYV